MSDIKLGFGFYRHMLNERSYRFARQCGATHAVVHLVDYTWQGRAESRDDQPVGTSGGGWGVAGSSEGRWTVEALAKIRDDLAQHGLTLAAIENLDPADWHDVLLDGPKRDEQIDHVRRIVRNLGEAGVPILGYNFSIAGVAGRIRGPFARGGATSVGMDGIDDTPLPRGMVWNMVVDPDAFDGRQPEIDEAELWRRAEAFLSDVLPVAEEAGVRLAAHPDDPPVPRLRRQPRLIRRPDDFQRLIDLHPSNANALEFCLGTLAEMPGDRDLYDVIEHHLRQGDVGYVHLRNVRGTAPFYREVFLDEGDLDVPRVIDVLDEAGYDGVIIPDHTPQLSCDAPWHAGMAHATGYLGALLQDRRRA